MNMKTRRTVMAEIMMVKAAATGGPGGHDVHCYGGRRRRGVTFFGGRRRRGFTLVEVIVVLAIIAILAAMAIPALTGYIDSADDKKYIVPARNALVASRTVLNEVYATGEINSAYVQSGSPSFSSNMKLRYWEANSLSPGFKEKAAAFLAQKYSGDSSLNSGYWGIAFIGPPGADSAPWNADGFFFDMLPDGRGSGKPHIIVTYRVKHIEVPSNSDALSTYWAELTRNGEYDPDAGYEVYQFVRK
jgi:prepilin-type N-terminal cleavage/methylation domain-containing protein